jgi:hypothetical protein
VPSDFRDFPDAKVSPLPKAAPYSYDNPPPLPRQTTTTMTNLIISPNVQNPRRSNDFDGPRRDRSKMAALRPQPPNCRPTREKHPGTRNYGAVHVSYWPSRDPIGERGGINLYGMVGNNAVSRWDYLGLVKIGTGKPYDEVAVEALAEALRLSEAALKKDNKGLEYCGSVCCKVGKYKATGPFPGRWRRNGVPTCDASFSKTAKKGCDQLGDGWKLVAEYHTHPGRQYAGFSLYDKYLTDSDGIPIYLAYPGYEYWERYDPDSKYDPKNDWTDGLNDKHGKPRGGPIQKPNGGQGGKSGDLIPEVPKPEVPNPEVPKQ